MIRSASLYAASSIISQLASFVILPLYTSTLSTSEFGVLSMVETYIFIFMAISSLAVERAAQRFFYDKSVSTKAFDFALSIIFLWGSFISLLLLFLCIALGVDFYQLGIVGVILVFVIGIGQNISALAQVYFQVMQKPSQYLSFVVLKVSLMFISVFWFLVYKDAGVLGYLYSLTITFIILAVISCKVMGGYRFFSSISNSKSREVSKSFIQFSLPFVPTVMSGWVLSMSGRLILDKFSSPENVAIYALGYKLSTSFFLVSSALTMTISPILYKNLSDNGALISSSLQIIHFSNLSLAIFGCGLVLFGQDLFVPFFGETYQDAFAIFNLLIFAHYLSAYMGLTSNNYLSFYKRTTTQMICFLIAASGCLIFSTLLTPHFASYGVVYASILSMLILLGLHCVVLAKLNLPSFRYSELLTGCSILLCANIVYRIYPGSIWGDDIEDFSVRVIFLLFLLVIFGVFSFRTYTKTKFFNQ